MVPLANILHTKLEGTNEKGNTKTKEENPLPYSSLKTS